MYVLTRHDLKDQLQHDQFTDAVSEVVTFASTNRQQVIRWSLIGAAVVIVAVGIWAFMSHQKAARQADLAEAMTVVDAQVGPPNEYDKTYPTEDAKNEAAIKALADVVAKDGDSNEGMIAQYTLATIKAKKDPKGAEPAFKRVADSGSSVAPLAKIALAQLYLGDKRTADAQDLLRSIVNGPSDLVSKAQAQLLLADVDATVDPQAAKSILKSLDATDQKRPAISRAVDSISGQLK